MGEISSLGDFVGLTIVWYQPVFWMLFYHYKTKKLNIFMRIQTLIVSGVFLAEFIPISYMMISKWFPSHRMLLTYAILGTLFTWYYMTYQKWDYPQAVSIAFLVIFIGSFYWEVPYLLRNAFITGFEFDWFLHLLVVFPLWYIHKTVGWTQRFSSAKKLLILASGLIISTLFLVNYPVSPRSYGSEVWDSTYYLFNRVICTGIFSLLVNGKGGITV